MKVKVKIEDLKAGDVLPGGATVTGDYEGIGVWFDNALGQSFYTLRRLLGPEVEVERPEPTPVPVTFDAEVIAVVDWRLGKVAVLHPDLVPFIGKRVKVTVEVAE